MKEIIYSFLGFIHQVPLRSTLAGIAIYNGEPIRDLGFLISNFENLSNKLVKLTYSGQKNTEVVVPSGTTFYNSSAFTVVVKPDGFHIYDSTNSSILAPYIICDMNNVIAGQYYFPKSIFPNGFTLVGSWTVSPVDDVPTSILNTLKHVAKLPESDLVFESNKSRTLSYLASVGLNIAKWLDAFAMNFEDDDEKSSRIDSAITPVVNLLIRKLNKMQKIELVQRLDEEGLPDECAEPGVTFDVLIETWARTILWNTILDACNFHEPKFRHQQAIPFDFGGRLYNQAMPRFF